MVTLEELLEAAPDLAAAHLLIAELHARTQTLQRNSDALRAETAFLKRSGSGASPAQLSRARNDLRDLRLYARKRNLDGDVLALLTGTGDALLLPGVASMDQTLKLVTAEDRGVRELRPLYMAATTRLGGLLAMTSTFRLVSLNGLGIRLSARMDWQDAARASALGLMKLEQVEAVCVVDEFAPPAQLVVVTRQGWCRALPWGVVENMLASGQQITPGEHTDAPVWLGASDGGAEDLLLLTRLGRWVRFPLKLVESSGAFCVSREQDDDVVAALILPSINADDAVQFVGADGAQFVVATAGLPAHKKPGAKSQPLIKNFVALTCALQSQTTATLMLTMTGDLVVSTTRSLPIAAKPSEARPLNVVGARVAAAMFL